MKIPAFCSFWSSDPKFEKPKPISYGAEFRSLMQRHAPVDFEEKYDIAKPFILSSLLAWPLFWLYKGLEWHKYQSTGPINQYISRTYLQSKILQGAILGAAFTYITFKDDLAAFSNVSFSSDQPAIATELNSENTNIKPRNQSEKYDTSADDIIDNRR